MKESNWVVAQEYIDEIAETFPDLPPLVAQLLWNRGVRTQHEGRSFLEPDYERDIHDPFLFQHMRRAVDRLRAAIVAQELIVVHGDYDADGISAASILTHTLRTLGARVEGFIPHREFDGYGVKHSTIDLLAGRGAQVIITCDCGISNAPEIEHARGKNIDVIVTDHHAIPEQLPDAYAILHPKVAGEPYPDKTLSGGGVAFKLMQGLLQDPETRKLLPAGVNPDGFQKWQLDLVAISSVADMVPLVGETRTLVHYGCMVLGKTRRPGLRALLARDKIIVTDKGSSAPITPITIGFKIAPRINAAGRMDHGKTAFEMLLADTEPEGQRLADLLFQHNINRQKLTEVIVKEAVAKIKEGGLDTYPVTVVAGEGWPAGVLGLIASRLKEKFYKPTFVIGINDDRIVGSGRSIDEWNMIAAMQTAPQLFTKFGGHPQACGFSLGSIDAIQEFANAMYILAEAHVANITKLIPTISIDARAQLGDLNWDVLKLLEKFEPYGMGNPEPRFLAEKMDVVTAAHVGTEGKHMRLMVKNGSPAIKKLMAFNMGEHLGRFSPGKQLDGVFTFGSNEWNGVKELQYKLHDFRLCE